MEILALPGGLRVPAIRVGYKEGACCGRTSRARAWGEYWVCAEHRALLDDVWLRGSLDPLAAGYVGHVLARKAGAPCRCERDGRGAVVDRDADCPWHGR